MSTRLDALGIRGRLGRAGWEPPEPFGPDGWLFRARSGLATIIVTNAEHDDGHEWVHASISRDTTPTYDDLVTLHQAVFREGYAYQCFVPTSMHVNIHTRALHLYGRLDGTPVLPEFSDILPGVGRSI